jgi:3-mercaptopyruvate sulfurtransferase SseA
VIKIKRVEHMGHENVKLYDASLPEWAMDPALPMEAG